MIAFVPAWAGLVFYGFYAVLGVVVFAGMRTLLQFLARRIEFAKPLGSGMPCFLASLIVGAFAVYCLLPRLWDFAEVNAAATPGMPFSAVVEQIGNPS